MKKTAIVLLLALICWLYPIKVLGQKTDEPKQKEPEVEQVISPSNEPFPSPAASTKPVAKEKTQPAKTKSQPVGSNGSYSGRHYSKEEVQQLIRDYSLQYGIDAEIPLCVARLESGFNQFSRNRNSTASGVFQYLAGTWKATDEGKAGLSVFDADANVRAAIKYMTSRKSTSPWVVGPRCPHL